MNRSHDVLVVGGGAIGVATAYHLSLQGIDVAVIERSHLGSGATGANAAIIGAGTTSPTHYAVFEERSKGLLSKLADRTGNALHYNPCGRLSLLQDDEALNAARTVVRRNREAGISVEILEPEDIARREPNIETAGIKGAVFCSTDGQLDPLATLRTLTGRLVGAGGSFYGHTCVQRIHASRRAVAVVCPNGTFQADTLIVAAGVHSSALVVPLGVKLPVRPVRGQILVTETLPKVFNHVISPGITQCREGNVLLGVSSEDAGFDRRTTLPVLRSIARAAVAKAPVLRTARLLRTFAGLRPMPEDGLPILDCLDDRERVIVAVAHNAVTSSQAIGESLAEWVREGQKPDSLVPFRLERFTAPA